MHKFALKFRFVGSQIVDEVLKFTSKVTDDLLEQQNINGEIPLFSLIHDNGIESYLAHHYFMIFPDDLLKLKNIEEENYLYVTFSKITNETPDDYFATIFEPFKQNKKLFN